ncbi:hypothetical protein [uncultured Methanobrevibacter sp.]|uniref:hypothetical protein n=1 Tax=uncultured Methanobrevibacter sp. TaxID=253161 RepID=UPI00261B7EE2|nr:hypothetical protein [uncultured Methanobrevibacter sp.]
MNNQNVNVKPGDEIVIVLPESAIDGDEIEIDLDALGIDVESLGENVNIVVQIEGDVDEDGFMLEDEDEDELKEPNEWYFDDDPYEIVYYEFPDLD